MRKMRVMVTKYGYAEFDWSDPDDGQVVDDDVDFE